MVVLLNSLEEGELAGIVDHHKLLEQGLDDLAGAGAGDDVQVLDCVLGQVEGRAARHHLGAQRLIGVLNGGRLLAGWHRDRPNQLQLHLDEASVGAVFVLGGGRTRERMSWAEPGNGAGKWSSEHEMGPGCSP